MEPGYRVPKLEEFVEGFMYQYKTSHGLMIFDPEEGKTIHHPMQDVWHWATVPNLEEKPYPHTFKSGGNIVSVMNDSAIWEKPLEAIKRGLSKNLIRAKMIGSLEINGVRVVVEDIENTIIATEPGIIFKLKDGVIHFELDKSEE